MNAMTTALIGFAGFCTMAFSASAQQGQLELYNGFDPEKPTIIAVHGWFGSVDYPSTFGRSPSFADWANVIGWEWDANFGGNITAKARESGRLLARDIYELLYFNVPDYDQPIQVIGHSLGGHVVLETAKTLRDVGRDDPDYDVYQIDQVTLVDACCTDEVPPAIEEIDGDYLVPLKLDNYFSPARSGGVGTWYEGNLANVRIPISHGNIWWYYFESLDQDTASLIEPCAEYGLVGRLAEFNFGAIGVYLVTGESTPLDLSDDVYRVLP